MSKLIPKLKVISREISDDYITYEIQGNFALASTLVYGNDLLDMASQLPIIEEMVGHNEAAHYYTIENDFEASRCWITIYTKRNYRHRTRANAIGSGQLGRNHTV